MSIYFHFYSSVGIFFLETTPSSSAMFAHWRLLPCSAHLAEGVGGKCQSAFVGFSWMQCFFIKQDEMVRWEMSRQAAAVWGRALGEGSNRACFEESLAKRGGLNQKAGQASFPWGQNCATWIGLFFIYFICMLMYISIYTFLLFFAARIL